MTSSSKLKSSHQVTLSSVPTANEIASTWLKGNNKLREPLVHPILPRDGDKNVLITSALPYVNNVPHLGNIIGCVLSADCYARYCRLRGYRTLFLCGTDEYGTATETKALEENMTCQQICDKYHKIHSDVYKWFNISFDFFGRTTTQHQTDIAQDIFLKLHKNGYLVEDTVDQLYCQKCSKFLADRFVEGSCPFCSYSDARGDQCDKCGKLINPIELLDPRCKICSSTPITKSSKHLYLDLPKVEPKLLEFIESSQANGLWSANSTSITKSWLSEGLKPRCITRDLKWGTPVPLKEFSEKVFYVWFDAPIGYISITANYTKEWAKWWKNPANVRLVNFMAKDNVPFHTVVFPASLLGTGDDYTLLSDISSTEYLNYESDKFSKSRGIGVFGNNAMDSNIPSDIFRLYLLANRPESHDTSFMWDDLISRNQNEFIGNIGNFINRSLSLLFKKFSGKLQEISLTEHEIQAIKNIDAKYKLYLENMEKYRIREAFYQILAISTIGNQYLQKLKPWELNDSDSFLKAKLGSILSFSANIVALLSLLLEPFSPTMSAQLRSDISFSQEKQLLSDEFVCLLEPGIIIKKPIIYFNKIDQKQGDVLREKYGGNVNKELIEGLTKDLTEKLDLEIKGKSKAQLENMIKLKIDDIKKLKKTKAEKSVIINEVGMLNYLRKNAAKISGCS